MPRLLQKSHIVHNEQHEPFILTVDDKTRSFAYITVDEECTTNRGTYYCISTSNYDYNRGIMSGKCFKDNLFYSFTIAHKIDDICSVSIYFWYITANGPHEISKTVEFDAVLSSSAKWQDYKLFCYTHQTFFLIENRSLEITYAQLEGKKVEIELNNFELISQSTFVSAFPIFSYEEGGIFGCCPVYCYLDSNLLVQPLNSGDVDKIDFFIDVLNADCMLHATEDTDGYSLSYFVLSDGCDTIDMYSAFPELKSCLTNASIAIKKKHANWDNHFDLNHCLYMVIFEVSHDVFEFSLIFRNMLFYCRVNADGTTEVNDFSHSLHRCRLFLPNISPDNFQRMQSFQFETKVPEILGITESECGIRLKHFVFRCSTNVFFDMNLNIYPCKHISNNIFVFTANNTYNKFLGATVFINTIDETVRVFNQIERFASVPCDPIINNQFMLVSTHQPDRTFITYVIDYTASIEGNLLPTIALPGQIIAHSYSDEMNLICCLQAGSNSSYGIVHLFNYEGVLLNNIRVTETYDSRTMFFVDNLILLQNSTSIMIVSFNEKFNLQIEHSHTSSPFFCYNPFKMELFGVIDGVERVCPLDEYFNFSSQMTVLNIQSMSLSNSYPIVFFTEEWAARGSAIIHYCDKDFELKFLGFPNFDYSNNRVVSMIASPEERKYLKLHIKEEPLRFILRKSNNGIDDSEVFEYNFAEMMKNFKVIMANVNLSL
ncbi:hypothetical protein PCE1_002988 [Barthelona sp. PCE]